MKLPSKQNIFTYVLILGLIVLDRLTKLIFQEGKNNIDWGWFAFTFVQNTGASFGILKDNNLLLIGVAIIAFGILIYYHKDIPKLPFIFLMSGLIGNVIDRIFFGYVIDFINFKFFPVFNIADSLITLGVAIWIIMALWKKK